MEFRHTDTDEFLKWLDSNPDGFVAVFGYASHLKLHKARCYSLRKPTDYKKDAIKFCDRERSTVEAWVARQELETDLPRSPPGKPACRSEGVAR